MAETPHTPGPSGSGDQPPQPTGDPYAKPAQSSPQAGQSSPQPGQSSHQAGQSYPQSGEAFTQAGDPYPQSPGQPYVPPTGQPGHGMGQPGYQQPTAGQSGLTAAPIATAPPKSNPVPKIIAGVVALGLLLITIIGFVKVWNGDAAWVKAGDCIQVLTDKKGQVTHKGVDCGAKPDTSVTYRVATVGQSTCPTEYYETYSETDKSGKELHTACMMPLLTAGQCYGQSGGGPLKQVACTDAAARIKVTKVIDRDDTTQCDADGEAANYPQPAPGRTYCVGNPS